MDNKLCDPTMVKNVSERDKSQSSFHNLLRIEPNHYSSWTHSNRKTPGQTVVKMFQHKKNKGICDKLKESYRK